MPSVRNKVGKFVLGVVLGIDSKFFPILPNLARKIFFIVLGNEQGISGLFQVLVGVAE